MKDRIKYIRKYFSLTQERFAEKFGVSRNAATNWERGGNVTPSHIDQLCRLFHVRKEWLLEGKEPIFEEKSELDQTLELYEKLSPNMKKVWLECAKILVDSENPRQAALRLSETLKKFENDKD